MDNIKTYEEFIAEALSPQERMTLNTFIGRLPGYTYSDPKQLGSLVTMIFGKPAGDPTVEQSDEYGGEMCYRFTGNRFSLTLYTESCPGGKNKIVKALLDEPSEVSESLNPGEDFLVQELDGNISMARKFDVILKSMIQMWNTDTDEDIDQYDGYLSDLYDEAEEDDTKYRIIHSVVDFLKNHGSGSGVIDNKVNELVRQYIKMIKR